MDWGRLPKYSKKKEKKLEEDLSNEKLTFKDKFAMLFAAYIVLVPPALLVIGVLVLIMVLIF